MIKDLAEVGTESAYEELQSIFKDPEAVSLLMEDEEGKILRSGINGMTDMLYVLGEHQNEDSYQLLKTFLLADYEKNYFRKFSYGNLLQNLLKYRSDKRNELVDILEVELGLVFSNKEAFEEKYPFLKDEGVVFDYRANSYLRGDTGEVVHSGVVVTEDSKSTRILSYLNSLGTEKSYDIVKSFLTSWTGRETPAAQFLPFSVMRMNRYDLPVVEIYSALIRDSGYSKKTRVDFVEHFFGNSISPLFSDVDDPMKYYAQIRSASEKALLRMLDVADYALSLDFLPTETGDLVFKKRAEIIDRLVAMGYSREELNKVDDAEAASDQANREANHSEPVTEKPAEVKTTEPVEEPAHQPSQWWLWLIGAVIVVGGIALTVRRKN